jgi:hypothetical protein
MPLAVASHSGLYLTVRQWGVCQYEMFSRRAYIPARHIQVYSSEAYTGEVPVQNIQPVRNVQSVWVYIQEKYSGIK